MIQSENLKLIRNRFGMIVAQRAVFPPASASASPLAPLTTIAKNALMLFSPNAEATKRGAQFSPPRKRARSDEEEAKQGRKNLKSKFRSERC
jgi:hypothetical protein